MGTKIDKILNKKGWTGAEVGKVLIACLVHDIEHRGQDKEPLFKEEDFRKMESSLDDIQWKTYGCYSSLYSCLVDMTNISQGQFQQFFHGFFRCFSNLSSATSEQVAKVELGKKPIIMTAEQYNRLKDNATERLRNTNTQYNYIIRDIIYYCLNHPDEAPKAIQKELEACKKELVTNKRILDNYNIDTDKGYYVYADGTRSDIDGKPSSKEGEANKPDALQFVKVLFNGVPEAIALFKERTGEELGRTAAQQVIDYIQAAMDGVSEDDLPVLDAEASRALLILTTGSEFDGKWNYYDTPTDLDKFTALDDNIDRYFGQYDIRYDAEADDDLEEISEEEQFKEFKEDYPKLYKAVHEYLVSVFPKADKLTGAKQFKTITTWGELSAAGIGSYIKSCKADKDDILDEYYKEPYCTDALIKRAEDYGIAVIDDPNEENVDEDGNYIEKPISEFFDRFIQRADEDAPTGNSMGYYRRMATTILIPAICFLYAYHALLDILAKVYSVPEIKIIKEMLCMDEVAEKIETMNSLIYLMYNQVSGTPAEKAEARKQIMERYFAIDIEKCKPSKEAIEDVEEQIHARFKRRETFDQVFRLIPFINKLKARGYEDE